MAGDINLHDLHELITAQKGHPTSRIIKQLQADNAALLLERNQLLDGVKYWTKQSADLFKQLEDVDRDNAALREQLELSAKSYDANKQGWEADIEDLRSEIEAWKDRYTGAMQMLEKEKKESHALRQRLARLVEKAQEAKEELEYDILNGFAIEILTKAIADAKRIKKPTDLP